MFVFSTCYRLNYEPYNELPRPTVISICYYKLLHDIIDRSRFSLGTFHDQTNSTRSCLTFCQSISFSKTCGTFWKGFATIFAGITCKKFYQKCKLLPLTSSLKPWPPNVNVNSIFAGLQVVENTFFEVSSIVSAVCPTECNPEYSILLHCIEMDTSNLYLVILSLEFSKMS